MIFPEIKTLCKYMSWNEFTKKSLTENTFWFSSPTSFNDPYDCEINLRTGPISETIESQRQILSNQISSALKNHEFENAAQYISKTILELTKSVENNKEKIKNEVIRSNLERKTSDIIKKQLSKLGILCLSEDPKNILMWSHYGGQHSGICVNIKRFSGNILGNKKRTLPVRYSTKKPLISAKEFIESDDKQREEILRSLAYTKSHDWFYEREWRICLNEGANKSLNIDCEIESIILGARSSASTTDFVKSLCAQRGIPIHKIEMNNEDYGLKVADFQ